MKKLALILMSLLVCLGLFAGCGSQDESTSNTAGDSSSSSSQENGSSVAAEKGDPDIKGILVVSFGTSYNDTRE